MSEAKIRAAAEQARAALQSAIRKHDEDGEPLRSEVYDARDILRDALRALAEQPQPEAQPHKLWLWRNFVDGRPEYWAFDNPYPVGVDHDDPQTLGEPVGYAYFKPSRHGRATWDEAEVLRAIARAAAPQPEYRSTGWAAKRDHYAIPVLFNPYTGEPRDVRDVQSDPQGILILPPGAQMFAAPPPAAQPEAPDPDYPCRSDGRCQYAIDSGAEGMGHCPRGKCVMPPSAPEPSLTPAATVQGGSNSHQTPQPEPSEAERVADPRAVIPYPVLEAACKAFSEESFGYSAESRREYMVRVVAIGAALRAAAAARGR